MGDTTIYTDARLAFRTDNNGNVGLAIHLLRKEPQLDYPYMGYTLSNKSAQLDLQLSWGFELELLLKSIFAVVHFCLTTYSMKLPNSDVISVKKQSKERKMKASKLQNGVA